MNFDLNTTAYLIYLPTVIGLTIFTAVKLFKNSKVFMVDIFHGKEEIATATNHLFKIGFYLLNIGFALLIIHMDTIVSMNDMIVTLSSKVGGFTIYLGILLLLHLLLFLRGRKNARKNKILKGDLSEPKFSKLD